MKKLIILGAGACVDFGFPSGAELCKEIHSLWNGPNENNIRLLLRTVAKHGKRFDDFEDPRKHAAERIKQLSDRFYYSSADSIDDFLSQPIEDFERSFGKLTVLNLILEKERESLIIKHPKSLFRWENNWLRILFAREFRFENHNFLDDKLTQHPLRFITFNYDRSLEYFIFTAIKHYYNLKHDEALSIYRKIEFFHVYGQLAPLEWESDDLNKRLKFGDDFKDFTYNSEEKLLSCIANIKVINEDRGSDNFKSTKDKCRYWIQDAQKVYILGFGFLEFNFGLLGIEEYKQSDPKGVLPPSKFYYTPYGLSEDRKADVVKRFTSMHDGICRAASYDLPIYEYMRHHY